MTRPRFDPLGMLEVLDRHGVAFVVIGGIAARLLGSPSLTGDLDLCPDRRPENLERLAAALADLDARLRGVDDEVPFLLDARTLAAGQNFTFSTRLGPLDVLGLPAGTRGYGELETNAARMDVGDVTVAVADIDDLIRMKLATGRPKDRIEVEVLTAVREERAVDPGAG